MMEPDSLVRRVDATLAGFLAARRAELETVGPELAPLAGAAERFVLSGGKRLRPLFAYWGWRSAGLPEVDDAAMVNAAAALELLHACALVHDDVMDASDRRRGAPSAHAEFAALHEREGFAGNAAVFGTAAAILLGDLLLSWADSLFAASAFDAATRARGRAVWDEMRQQVMAGQYLDVLVQARGDVSVEDALRVVEYKTGKYTIEGPLLFGAAVAGAAEPVRATLSAYARPLGTAFQLRDDVLGVFGDPGHTGKPAGDDLREGKRTLLVALALAWATPEQAAQLRAALGDRSLDEAGVARVCGLIVATGALADVERRIADLGRQARAALSGSVIVEDVRAVLDALAIQVTQRIR